MQLSAVILAAGLGTRMKSRLPKVLFEVAGEPLVSHVISTVRSLHVHPEKIILVVGHSRELVIETVKKSHPDTDALRFVVQAEQHGTGHALIQAREELSNQEGSTFVLCGDTPLLTPELLENLYKFHTVNGSDATVLTTRVREPRGYGRIVRTQDGRVKSIIEERDASDEVRKINEINTGVYLFSTKKLLAALDRLKPENDQHEYYLTDTIGILNSWGSKAMAYEEAEDHLMMGINNRFELSVAERYMRERINRRHMIAGVTIVDPATTYIESKVRISADVTIFPNTHLKGSTEIDEGSIIGPDSLVENSKIGKGCVVRQSTVEDSRLASNVKVGPYSHIRPGTFLDEGVHIGNYVEVKKSSIGANSKANHLTYIGDAEIGSSANVGAGTITCNYDGVNKNKTKIGDAVFIGSNTALVAPVEIGEGSLVAAGSVITKNVPPFSLAIERCEQVIKIDYMKKRKIEKNGSAKKNGR